MINADLMVAAAISLQLFAVLSAIDGLYLHLWRLRLHARPGAYGEHLWHTARAVLFAPTAAIVFLMPSAGPLLWLGVGLVLIDLLAGVGDALSERDARAALGGLGRGEYALHVVLVAVHATAVTLALAARAPEAWSPSAPIVLGPWPPVAMLVGGVIAGGVAVAGLHVALAWRHRPRATGATLVAA